jgi:hypothetical protein
MTKAALVLVSLLMLCVPAVADVVTASQTLTYESNRMDANGPWFIPPGNTMDHSPYHRGMWEDWGWAHDMNDLIPPDANGIASASLTIRTWGVDVQAPDGAEIDKIYVVGSNAPVAYFHNTDGLVSFPATCIGQLEGTEAYCWGTTHFTLPADVLTRLWRDRGLRLFMNIDTGSAGRRVSLTYSMLTVNYTVPHTSWEPDLPVYWFRSPTTGENFYTASEKQRDKVLTLYSAGVWTYQGVAYFTYRDKRDDSVLPVYRFWSPKTQSHFYTANQNERDKLMAYCSRIEAVGDGIPCTWIYEGVAFHAQVEAGQMKGILPVYRFWSNALGRHLYTTSETEKDQLGRQPKVWTYEGIAWYASQYVRQ